MADLKKGDRVYFSSVARLVNEGTVEAVEGCYIKVKTKCPGTEYIMKKHAFSTKEELRQSESFENAWASQQERRRMRESFTRMCDMSIF